MSRCPPARPREGGAAWPPITPSCTAIAVPGKSCSCCPSLGRAEEEHPALELLLLFTSRGFTGLILAAFLQAPRFLSALAGMAIFAVFSAKLAVLADVQALGAIFAVLLRRAG